MKSQQNTDILKITPYPFVVTKYCILQLYVHNISEVNKKRGIMMRELLDLNFRTVLYCTSRLCRNVEI